MCTAGELWFEICVYKFSGSFLPLSCFFFYGWRKCVTKQNYVCIWIRFLSPLCMLFNPGAVGTVSCLILNIHVCTVHTATFFSLQWNSLVITADSDTERTKSKVSWFFNSTILVSWGELWAGRGSSRHLLQREDQQRGRLRLPGGALQLRDVVIKPVLWIRIGFSADPNPAFYLSVDPHPDPGSQPVKWCLRA